jgi:hypothetical protein
VQSSILVGLVAPSSAAQNAIEMDTMNDVLGGTFTSRLNMNLREDKHWSYGVRSSLPDALGERPWLLAAPVQTDRTVEAMRELKREIEEFVGPRPSTTAEIRKVMNRQVRALSGRYETNAAVASAIAEMIVFDRPDDYVRTLKDRIEVADRQRRAGCRARSPGAVAPDLDRRRRSRCHRAPDPRARFRRGARARCRRTNRALIVEAPMSLDHRPRAGCGALVLAALLLPARNVAASEPLDPAAAQRFATLALACVHKEYPNKIAHVLSGDADVQPPRSLTPAFYGCYDWHSAVHAHWLLARIAAAIPRQRNRERRARRARGEPTPENIGPELDYMRGQGRTSFERPYGLAWLLALAAELRSWNDPQARTWVAALSPLEAEAAARIASWLPKLHYPIRIGEHSQTAFAFGLIHDWARIAGNSSMLALLESRGRDYYLGDRDCPLAYEPSARISSHPAWPRRISCAASSPRRNMPHGSPASCRASRAQRARTGSPQASSRIAATRSLRTSTVST